MPLVTERSSVSEQKQQRGCAQRLGCPGALVWQDGYRLHLNLIDHTVGHHHATAPGEIARKERRESDLDS